MIKKKKICIKCNNEAYIWSKSMCKSCFMQNSPKKAIKKSSISKKPTKKGLELKDKKKEYTEKQFELFKEIWNEREHVCFETGKKLYGEPLSTMFHHCLYKSQYPQFALEKENIVILDPDIHQLTHINMDKTPKIKEYTRKLKEKWLN